MGNKAVAVFIQYDERLTDKEAEKLFDSFWKTNKDKIEGMRYHLLESTLQAREMIEKLEKASGLGQKIKFDDEGKVSIDPELMKQIEKEENKENF